MDRDATEQDKSPASLEGSATGIRLGCGALIGAVIGVPWAFSAVIDGSGWVSAAELVACVAICAILSGRFGDRFYEILVKCWPWL